MELHESELDEGNTKKVLADNQHQIQRESFLKNRSIMNKQQH
jgi:hypothetical protein